LNTYAEYVSLSTRHVYPIRMAKTKLTLSVDKDVLAAARKSRINVSALTEMVLSAVSEIPGAMSPQEELGRYGPFFESLRPILAAYRSSVSVGLFVAADDEVPAKRLTEDLRLYPDGGLAWDPELPLLEEELPRVEFLTPFTILRNLIEEIRTTKAKLGVQDESLHVAQDFVEVLSRHELRKLGRPPAQRVGRRQLASGRERRTRSGRRRHV